MVRMIWDIMASEANAERSASTEGGIEYRIIEYLYLEDRQTGEAG